MIKRDLGALVLSLVGLTGCTGWHAALQQAVSSPTGQQKNTPAVVAPVVSAQPVDLVDDAVAPPKDLKLLPVPTPVRYVREVRAELGKKLLQYSIAEKDITAAVQDIEACRPLSLQIYSVLADAHIAANKLNPAVEELVQVQSEQDLATVVAKYIRKEDVPAVSEQLKKCTLREELWRNVLSRYNVPGTSMKKSLEDLGTFYEKEVSFIERYGYVKPEVIDLDKIDVIPGKYK